MQRTPFLAPLACVFAAGCYVSSTTLPSALAAGQSVHLELNDRGTVALTPQLGPRALALDGRVVARTDTSLDVLVSDITRIGGTEETWHGATVTVPSSALGRAQTRRLSVFQSVVIAAVGVGALVAAALALKGDENIGTGTGTGGSSGGK